MTDTTVVAEETPVEITELEKIEAERVDGVKNPANGTPILMMKALPDAPPVDHDAIRAAAVKAAEADLNAERERGSAPVIDVAELAKAVAEALKDSRTFTADQRSKQADQGNALPDGSYPIPDADALRRAAILARSKHGNYKAARRLIARRAKELGVANPLKGGKSDTAGKSVLADQEQSVNTDGAGSGKQTESLSKADVKKLVAAAVTEATEGAKAEIESLRAELAKVKATPIPGGPVMSIAMPPQGAPKADDRAAKAAQYRAQAETVMDPELAERYRQAARQLEEQPS